MSREIWRASQMSAEWVHPGQTLIWAVWILAAAAEGKTPNGRGGLSEDGVEDFPMLEDFPWWTGTYCSEVSEDQWSVT